MACEREAQGKDSAPPKHEHKVDVITRHADFMLKLLLLTFLSAELNSLTRRLPNLNFKSVLVVGKMPVRPYAGLSKFDFPIPHIKHDGHDKDLRHESCLSVRWSGNE